MSQPKKSLMDGVKGIFDKPSSEFKVEMTVKKEVKPNHICDMCGISVATCVIYDPNIYPANDFDNREHYWDVCNDCRDFVNEMMGKSYEVMVELAMDRAKQSSSEA